MIYDCSYDWQAMLKRQSYAYPYSTNENNVALQWRDKGDDDSWKYGIEYRQGVGMFHKSSAKMTSAVKSI